MSTGTLFDLIGNLDLGMKLKHTLKVKCYKNLDDEFSTMFNKLILNAELFYSLEKQLLSDLKKLEIDYLDFVDLEDSEIILRFYAFLKENDYDFIVIDGKMMDILEGAFFFDEILPSKQTALFSNKQSTTLVGNIFLGNKEARVGSNDTSRKIECLINSTGSLDGMIICGKKNSLSFNYQVQNPIFEPELNLVMDFNYKIDKKKFKVMKIFDTCDSDYINYIREKKLNYLL